MFLNTSKPTILEDTSDCYYQMALYYLHTKKNRKVAMIWFNLAIQDRIQDSGF